MDESDQNDVYNANTDVSDASSDIDCDMETQNPLSVLAVGGGHNGDNGGSDETQASQSLLDHGFQPNKRQRINTGGKSNENTTNSLSLDDKVSMILNKMTDYDSKMAEINKKLDISLQLKEKIYEIENTVCLNIDRLTLLEYKSIDLEARSRRKNLIFGGFAEERNEDCALTIRQFLREKLHITDLLAIDRSHRLGRFNRDGQRRIIVAFRDYSDTELILSKAHLLKNTSYHINRDYPVEITNARKALWAEYKHLKSQSKSPKIVYPAKLIVENRVVKDMFPQWNVVMSGSRVHAHEINVHDRHYSRDTPQDARATRSPDRGRNTEVTLRGEHIEYKGCRPKKTEEPKGNSNAGSSWKPVEKGHSSAPRQDRGHRARSKQRNSQTHFRHRSNTSPISVSDRSQRGATGRGTPHGQPRNPKQNR